MSQHGGWARMTILVLLAIACAAVSNLAASRERKMSWVGSYSRALEVAPASSAAAVPVTAAAPTPGPATLAAVAPSPAPAVAGTVSASPPAGAAAPPAGKAPAAVPTLAPADTARPAPAPPAASKKAFPPHPDRASVEIGTGDSEQLFREGRLFLDARRTSAYADGHIKGARSMPVWESDIADRVKAFYEEGLDQNAPIVIYCSGGDCEDSHMLAEKLYFVGFNNLLVDKDGFPGWQKRGLPAVKGSKP